MKTLTEFAAITIKNAAKTRQELTAAGKTAEELPQAMGEALKLEGDKLNFLMNAIDVVGDKHNDLKRVIVMTLNEGEKAPGKAEQKGEHYYVTEYFPPIAKKGAHPAGKEARGGRDDRRGKRGDKKGKRGERGGRGGDGKKAGERGGERGPRGPRGPRGDKKATPPSPAQG